MDCEVSRKAGTKKQCGTLRFAWMYANNKNGLEGLSVADQTFREFAKRSGFPTHADLPLFFAGSRRLFNDSRCQCRRLRPAETKARKRGPAGKYLLAKFDTLPRRHP